MQPWTTRYASWTGPFAELIQTANTILATEFPGVEAVTERTARHYQQVGTLGKGQKSGRSAQFTFEDLAALVNSKALAKDVGLKMISALSQNYAPSTVSTNYLAASSPTASLAACAPAAFSASAAVTAVAQLLAAAPATDPLPGLAYTNGALRSARGAQPKSASSLSLGGGHDLLARSISSVPAAPVPSLFAHHHPTPWLTVAVDDTAAQTAPAPERAQAAAFLTALAARLTQE